MNIDKLQSGDLLFCWRETVLSEGIQAVTQSPFSHVAVVNWNENTLQIGDSQIDGFTLKEFHDWKNQFGYKFVAMRNNKADNVFLQDVKRRIINIVGTKYDFVSLIVRKPVNIVRRIVNVVRRNDKPLLRQKDALKRLYCSEACSYIIGLENIDLTPQELFTEITLKGWEIVEL